LAEIHPLVLSHWILEWGWFRDFSPTQIVGLLACFVDIRLEKEEDRHSVPFTRDVWLKSRIEEIRQSYEELELVDEIQFDMTDAVMDWVDCEDEYSCKVFIQGKIGGEMGVSIGDWTKAMLKMAVIVQELVAIAESQFQVECAHKLSRIPAMILKYVTTAQSLYV
jgi:hypothetical protein